MMRREVLLSALAAPFGLLFRKKDKPLELRPEQLRNGVVIHVDEHGEYLAPIRVVFRGGPLYIDRVTFAGDAMPFLILGEHPVTQ